MKARQRGPAELVCGAGGILLIVSLFLPWAGGRNGWELWTMADIFFGIAGGAAILMALTGGRVGVFRPDMSLRAMADLLGVISTLLLAWLLLFDFPAGAGREIGAFLALIGAMAAAGGAGDYSVLRPGASMFPRLDAGGTGPPPDHRSSA
jgi:hypothetical protein